MKTCEIETKNICETKQERMNANDNYKA